MAHEIPAQKMIMYPSDGCQPGAGARRDRPGGHHVDDPNDCSRDYAGAKTWLRL